MIYEIMNWEPRNSLLAFAFIVFSFYVIVLGRLDFAHGDGSCMNDAKFPGSNFCKRAAIEVIGPKNLFDASMSLHFTDIIDAITILVTDNEFCSEP